MSSSERPFGARTCQNFAYLNSCSLSFIALLGTTQSRRSLKQIWFSCMYKYLRTRWRKIGRLSIVPMFMSAQGRWVISHEHRKCCIGSTEAGQTSCVKMAKPPPGTEALYKVQDMDGPYLSSLHEVLHYKLALQKYKDKKVFVLFWSITSFSFLISCYHVWTIFPSRWKL